MRGLLNFDGNVLLACCYRQAEDSKQAGSWQKEIRQTAGTAVRSVKRHLTERRHIPDSKQMDSRQKDRQTARQQIKNKQTNSRQMKNRYQTGKQDIDRQQTVDSIQTPYRHHIPQAYIYQITDRHT